MSKPIITEAEATAIRAAVEPVEVLGGKLVNHIMRHGRVRTEGFTQEQVIAVTKVMGCPTWRFLDGEDWIVDLYHAENNKPAKPCMGADQNCRKCLGWGFYVQKRFGDLDQFRICECRKVEEPSGGMVDEFVMSQAKKVGSRWQYKPESPVGIGDIINAESKSGKTWQIEVTQMLDDGWVTGYGVK